MELAALIITIVFGILAAYLGVRQIRKWRAEARDRERDKEEKESEREEIRKGFEQLRSESGGAGVYEDGLTEMPDSRRRSLLIQGLEAMRRYAFSEAIGFLRECLGEGVKESEKIALLILIGNCFLSISQLREAEGHYSEARAMAKEANNKDGLSAVLGNMGIIYQTKGELDEALEYHQQALEIDREIGKREGEADDLGNMGIIYQIKGELDMALEHHQQALEIDREIGKREGEASDLGNMGNVYQTKGELDKALEHYERALEIFEEIGASEGIRIAKGNIKRLRGQQE